MKAARLLALLYLLALLPGTLNAQDVEDLSNGEQIRLQYRLPGEQETAEASGFFVANDSMFLSIQGIPGSAWSDTVSVPLAGIMKLEVLRGANNAALRGGLVGGIVGAGTLYLAGVAACNSLGGQDGCTGKGGMAAVGGIGGAMLGMLFGSKRKDRWVEVPLEQLSIVPLPNGRFGLGFSIPTSRRKP